MLSHFLASPNFELAFCIPNKLNETDKNSIINFINSNDKEEVYSPVYPRQFLNQVCNKYNIFEITYHHEENNPFIDGVKGVILRYLLINEIHTMLFDDGDSRKIEVLVQRNDYKSKLLNKFLTYFEWIIIYFEQRQVFVQEE
jgi:hypothetical protein